MREATLCHPVADGRVLLIEKKRGVGEGKVNGPGGKLEDDETPLDCVVREVREEVGISVDPWKVGELDFTFGDEPFMFVHVFRADDPVGDLVETGEARPVWFDVEDIPFDRMWADDRYWVPHLLDGTPFRGDAVFDEDGEGLSPSGNRTESDDGEKLLEWELETSVQFE